MSYGEVMPKRPLKVAFGSSSTNPDKFNRGYGQKEFGAPLIYNPVRIPSPSKYIMSGNQVVPIEDTDMRRVLQPEVDFEKKNYQSRNTRGTVEEYLPRLNSSDKITNMPVPKKSSYYEFDSPEDIERNKLYRPQYLRDATSGKRFFKFMQKNSTSIEMHKEEFLKEKRHYDPNHARNLK